MAPKLRTTPRKQPRQQRSLDTVDAILSATAQILVKHGYEGANTNRISEAAGVSVGSLYQYFPSKEALISALIERHSEAMWRLTEERTARVAHKPLPEAAREVIGAIFAAHAVEPKLHRVMMEQVPRVGALRQINDVTARCIALVQGYLELRKREILPRDTALAAFVIVQTVEALAHGSFERPADLASGALLDEATAVVLRYLTGAG